MPRSPHLQLEESSRRQQLSQLATDLSLEIMQDLGSYSSVGVLRCRSTKTGQDATMIVKVPDPDNRRSDGEAPMLQCWNSAEADFSRLLRQQGNVLVLEDIPQAQALWDIGSVSLEQSRLLGQHMAKLHTCSPLPQVDNLMDLFPALHQKLLLDPDLPEQAKAMADQAATEILTPQAPPCALHGDLHWGNVLAAAERVVVIDPYGWVGPAAYDLAVFVARLRERQEEHLTALLDGYGGAPDGMGAWLRWAAADSLRLALRYWPAEMAYRRALVDRLVADSKLSVSRSALS